MSNLNIDIHSFSFKKGGIPKDLTGNGGGFVFDCRGILNPGRIEKYKTQTGSHESVKTYLKEKTKIHDFLAAVEQLVSLTVDDYLERNFENLQINFGCTGGQHRSVYAANHVAQYLAEKYPEARVKVTHDEQPQLNTAE